MKTICLHTYSSAIQQQQVQDCAIELYNNIAEIGESPFGFGVESMEDGGVDRTVIDYRQNQLGQMADFPPLITFLIFDL